MLHAKIKDFKKKNLAMAAFISKVMQSTLGHPNNHQTVNRVYQRMF